MDISIGDGSPSTSITLILAITVLSIAPSVLLLATSFTKIIVVLGLTRNALGPADVAARTRCSPASRCS